LLSCEIFYLYDNNLFRTAGMWLVGDEDQQEHSHGFSSGRIEV